MILPASMEPEKLLNMLWGSGSFIGVQECPKNVFCRSDMLLQSHVSKLCFKY